MTMEIGTLDHNDRSATKLLLLMRYHWEHSTGVLDIRFSTPGASVPENASAQNTDLTNYKVVLILLFSDRFLELQQYLPFPRLMSEAWVHSREARTGWVSCSDPDDGSYSYFENFRFNEEENSLEFQQDGATLSDLQKVLASYSIRDNIFKRLVPIKEVVTYNLTERIVTPSRPSIFAVNRKLREHSLEFFDTNVTEMELTTHKTIANFDGTFPPLKYWASPIFSNCRLLPDFFGSRPPKRILIRFDLADNISLCDVLIDATQLFKAKKLYEGPVKLRVGLQSTSETSVSEEPTTMKLIDFQDRFLVALEDFTASHAIDFYGDYPTIWFDGHLAAREVESGLITPCRTAYTPSDISRVATEMRERARAALRRSGLWDRSALSLARHISGTLPTSSRTWC